jgi:hypothetical protein
MFMGNHGRVGLLRGLLRERRPQRAGAAEEARAATVFMLLSLSAPSHAVEGEQALRPLSTDRPDITESSNTVDRGHFQVECELGRYVREGDDGEWSLAELNLKYGVFHQVDVQLVLATVVGTPTDEGHDFGFGDSALRVKINWFGNDGGKAALALMPWVGVPTGGARGSEAVEGGLMIPFNFKLPLGFSGALMVEFDAINDALDDDYHLELLTSQALGRRIAGGLGAFLEAVQIYSSEPDVGYAVLFDGGLTYLVTEYSQLDAGGGAGVTDAAPDWFAFAGASAKF